MAGEVFISCGQRDHERTLAERISALLRDEFRLTPYLAFKTQSLNDIMTITQKLRSADYYLFIDFLRAPKGDQELACSLFTHQELGLAHHLGFKDEMIALQQRGAPLEGFLKYVLSNPEKFDSDDDLLGKIKALVSAKGWSPNYSRNLNVSSELEIHGPLVYQDHTGSNTMKVWNAKIKNDRPDVAAVRTVCILDEIKSNGKRDPSPDRGYLKWALRRNM